MVNIEKHPEVINEVKDDVLLNELTSKRRHLYSLEHELILKRAGNHSDMGHKSEHMKKIELLDVQVTARINEILDKYR